MRGTLLPKCPSVGTFVDTHVLSKVYDGRALRKLPEDCIISSVVACEFLLVYTADPTKPRYHVPFINFTSINFGSSNKCIRQNFASAKYGGPFVDKMAIGLPGNYPSRFEVGRLGISFAINAGSRRWIASCLRDVDRPTKKLILSRFDFMIGRGVRCVPVTIKDFELSKEILLEFTRIYNLKKKFHNSFNDFLILAAAVNGKCALVTEDSLLIRFAAEYFGRAPEALADGIRVNFGGSENSRTNRRAERRGYRTAVWFGHRSR